MKKGIIILALVLGNLIGLGQTIVEMCNLDPLVKETSGLLLLNGKLITHNDSGGKPILYEVDTLTGTVTREVVIKNAKNVDWEDVTADEEFIYIADIGNNKGKRDNLKIYKIRIDEYLVQDSVKAEKIKISYADQKDFNPGKYMTNFDAESLVAIGDSLYMFSKNWGNHQTRMYALPKKTGEYQLQPKAQFKAKCLVTAADYNSAKDEILLIGYLFKKQCVMRLDSFELGNIAAGRFVSQPFTVPENFSKQIEGVVHLKGYEYLISAEAYQGNKQVLYKLIWKPEDTE